MIINKRLKFCFIQNPKCASTYVGGHLKKIEGSTSGKYKKHIHREAIRADLTGYKVFGTIRNPLSLYESIYSYSLQNKSNHLWRFFQSPDVDSFCDRLVRLAPVNTKKFEEFYGISARAARGLGYGWATFSYIHYFSVSRNFKSIEKNQFIHAMRMEDDLPTQIKEYLGLEISGKTINPTFTKIKMSNETTHKILQADEYFINKFYGGT